MFSDFGKLEKFLSLPLSLSLSLTHTHTHTHILYLFLYISVCLSVRLSFVCPYVCPSVRVSFFLFLVSNFPFKTKVSHFSSSRNSRRDRELFLVPENRWREVFGNCFHENFGNWRDMTGKLWCLEV
jgi:hypothetical protein